MNITIAVRVHINISEILERTIHTTKPQTLLICVVAATLFTNATQEEINGVAPSWWQQHGINTIIYVRFGLFSLPLYVRVSLSVCVYVRVFMTKHVNSFVLISASTL